MPRLWDLTTEQGKRNLIIKARQLGMLDFKPDGNKGLLVHLDPKLEPVEEIDRLIRQAPDHYKDNIRARGNDK